MLGMFIEWIGDRVHRRSDIHSHHDGVGIQSALGGNDGLHQPATAFQTPPMAMSIFVLKGTAPKELGVTMWDIIKGVIPFILIIMLVLVLCSIFPEIIPGWLPEKSGRFGVAGWSTERSFQRETQGRIAHARGDPHAGCSPSAMMRRPENQ